MDIDGLGCFCHWRYVWHGYGPRHIPAGMQERTPTVVAYAHDCPVPEHAGLAALLSTTRDDQR